MNTSPLVEATLEDAKEVILDRFSDKAKALSVLDAVMRNPLRKIEPDAGDIVYSDGKPVCFQACILRRLYLGKRVTYGMVGGLTCLKRGAPVEAYIDVKRAADRPRHGSLLGFGNSQNVESSKAAHRLARKKNAISFEGPETCTFYLCRAIRPIECAMYFVRRKIIKAERPRWKSFSTISSADYNVKNGNFTVCRMMEIRPEFFDVLMREYIEHNEGLVCSRTAEELEWVFGERIRNGECILLGVSCNGTPMGHIIAGSGADAKRWQLLDWFAVKNDLRILEILLAELCAFLKHKTPAMLLESIGFPMYTKSLLKRYLPYKRPINRNVFSWGSGSKDFRESVLPVINTEKSWFYGPYDGDECIG